MKKLQNNFTTPEQSKSLLELGVPADSADCYYIDSMTFFQDKSPYIIPSYYKYSDGIPNGYESRFCPCWSVGRLMEIYVKLSSFEYVSLIFKKTFTPMDKILDKFEKDVKNGLLDFSKLED